MKNKTGFSAVLIGIVIMIMMSSLASAATTCKYNIKSVTTGMKTTVTKTNVVSSVASNAALTASSITYPSGCSQNIVWETQGGSTFNVPMWTYYQQVDWCYSNGKITSKSVNDWGKEYGLTWYYAGHVRTTENGGKGQTYYTAKSEGKFVLPLILPVFGCNVQYKYPWLEQTVYPSGRATYRYGQ